MKLDIMKKIVTLLPVTMLALMPFTALAAEENFGKLGTFVREIGGFINATLIPILLALAFLVFIVGAVRFFLLAGKDNAEAQKKGKSLMLYGLLAFVLIISIWGIVNLIANGLGFTNKEGDVKIPAAPITN